MTNILEAIYNIVQHGNYEIRTIYEGRNRANSMGDALECYVKDAFADTLRVTEESETLKIYEQKYSWLGSQNNPPDIMIKSGDAIEVKKTQSANSSLALNSSYPKADLKNTSPMITSECRLCETWDVKDLIYCVGHTSDTQLKSLWMVYGSIYAAKHETYQKIKEVISKGIKTIPDVIFSETKELGRVNKVDPLGITNLRIRGMWQIDNPRKVFSYVYRSRSDRNFELVAIIPSDKFERFPIESKKKIENIQLKQFVIKNTVIKDPNNPAKLKDCKLITYSI